MSMNADELIQTQSQLLAFNALIKAKNWSQVNRQFKSSEFLQSFYSGRWMDKVKYNDNDVPAMAKNDYISLVFKVFLTLLRPETLDTAKDIYHQNSRLQDYYRRCNPEVHMSIFRMIVKSCSVTNYDFLVQFLENTTDDEQRSQLIKSITDSALLGAIFHGTNPLSKLLTGELLQQLVEVEISSSLQNEESVTLMQQQSLQQQTTASDFSNRQDFLGQQSDSSLILAADVTVNSNLGGSVTTTSDVTDSQKNTTRSTRRTARDFINNRYQTMTTTLSLEPPRRILGKRGIENNLVVAVGSQRQVSHQDKRQRWVQQQSTSGQAQQASVLTIEEQGAAEELMLLRGCEKTTLNIFLRPA